MSNFVIQRDRTIPMTDGVRIKADVYLPLNIQETVPTLVCYSPFGKEVQAMAINRKPLRTGQAMYDQTIEVCDMHFFLENGYAIVIASPRGVGNSQGVNHGYLGTLDQLDCCEVINWVARQEWSNKKVGMIGTGFAGRIQPLVAAHNPTPLKAIMPIDLIDNLYKEYYPGGIRSDYSFGYDGLIPANSWECESIKVMGEETFKERLSSLRKEPEMIASSYTWRSLDSWPISFHPFTVDCFVNNKYNEFWSQRGFENKTKDIKIPVYAVSFWYEFGRSTISAINLYTDPELNVTKKLMIADAGYQKRQPCDQLNTEMLKWYDFWLKGIENNILKEKPIKLFVMGEDSVIESDKWPVDNMEHTKLYLSQQEKLQEIDGTGDFDTLYHQPPTKVSQGKYDIPFINYETEEFIEDTTYVGNVSANLYIAIDKKDANINAYLWDVDPNGQKILISSGYLKASCRALKNPDKYVNVNNDLSNNIPVLENSINEYRFEMNAISITVKKGHKLRLHIKAMDYPTYDYREKSTFPLLFPSGRVIGPIPGTEFVNYKLYHNNDLQSYIMLPKVKK